MGKTAGKNQAVQKSKKEEKEEMKVEFTVTKEGKEQDPKLQELQKRRATYRANLSYAVQMQDKYATEYTEAVQTEAVQTEADQLSIDKLELKLAEQKLRIEFYGKKIAEVEEEIARYKVERKKEILQDEKTTEDKEKESAA